MIQSFLTLAAYEVLTGGTLADVVSVQTILGMGLWWSISTVLRILGEMLAERRYGTTDRKQWKGIDAERRHFERHGRIPADRFSRALDEKGYRQWSNAR